MTTRNTNNAASTITETGTGHITVVGTFINDGVVVANGNGVNGTLTINANTLTSNVESTGILVAQGDGSKAGWYATNTGKLILPAAFVAAPITVGDNRPTPRPTWSTRCGSRPSPT